MDFSQKIYYKLEKFTRRYYAGKLVKGLIFFFLFVGLLLLAVLGLEYSFWLGSSWRLLLFFLLTGGLIVLLYAYVLVPLLYFFRVRKGITPTYAAQLIGKHFPDVDDGLVNFLDLSHNENQSELLLASISQRYGSLEPVPFEKAVDIGHSFKYAKYLLLPLVLICIIWATGRISSFFDSYERVIHYNKTYSPPAPFSFVVDNTKWEVLDTEDFTVTVGTVGAVKPEQIYIVTESGQFVMEGIGDGKYAFDLPKPLYSQNVYFIANEVRSETYSLRVLPTPVTTDFRMKLFFPNYLNKSSEVVTGTGNARVPEGTRVEWELDALHTDEVSVIIDDSLMTFSQDKNTFSQQYSFFLSSRYELRTTNEFVRQAEALEYGIEVVPDEYPSIRVTEVSDSLKSEQRYYLGKAKDDYAVVSIKLAYFKVEQPDEVVYVDIEEDASGINQFFYTFPSGIEVAPGIDYGYYFVATDNDGLRGGKEAVSQTFYTRILSKAERENALREDRKEAMKALENVSKNIEEQDERLNSILKENVTKSKLNYQDRKKVDGFLKDQKRQEQLMQKFSQELQQDLEKLAPNDVTAKLLKERLERQELEARKNEALMKQLDSLSNKIDKEELAKRLEQLSKSQSNSERNLKQLLELTKRFYLTQEMERLAKELDTLAQQQDRLSDDVEGLRDDRAQSSLNQRFDSIAQELKALDRENNELSKPMDIDSEKSEEVAKNQKRALESLREADKDIKNRNVTKKAQQNAAKGMKEMADNLRAATKGGEGGASREQEDARMLRQILDNLVDFSFEQEELVNNVQEQELALVGLGSHVKGLNHLRQMFQHVDDSIFALSLRRPELSEFVNEQITEVYYNMDQAIERMAQNQVYQGVASEQFALSASNRLSDFLANILDNMQSQMQMGSSQGSGSGQGFQLPDIIQSQQELRGKMQGAMGQGSSSGGKSGEGQSGQGKEKGQGGSGQGNSGEGGQGGEQGTEGSKGSRSNGQGQGRGHGEGGGSGNGNRDADSMDSDMIYRIYQEQERLRMTIEEQLSDQSGAAHKRELRALLREMLHVEDELLNNGITQAAVDRMIRVENRMLRMEQATFSQEKESQRQSSTAKDVFKGVNTNKPYFLRDKDSETEILDKQVLPLRSNFKFKVNRYFQELD